MALPYPGMTFTAYDVLHASELNQMVGNIDYLDNLVEGSMNYYATNRTRIFIDGTNGNDNNDGLASNRAKKTLSGIANLINRLGGNVDVRFVSAGTYDITAGYFDSVNLVFEKNSSSLGTITINVVSGNVSILNFNNSYVTFKNMTISSTSNLNTAFYNSEVDFQDSVVGAFVNLYTSAIVISGASTLAHRIYARYSSSISISNNCLISLTNALTSGAVLTASHNSHIFISNVALTLDDLPSGSSGAILLNAINSSQVTIHQNASIIDNTVTKYSRGLTSDQSLLFITSSFTNVLNSLGTSGNSIARSLQVFSGGTIGS